MRRRRRIAVTTAVTAGLVGVAGASMAAVPALAGTPSDSPHSRATTTGEREAALQQLAAVQATTRALGSALAEAQRELDAASRAAEVSSGGGGWPSTAMTSTPPRARPSTRTTERPHTQPSTTPGTHTTTGASGSSGGGDDGGDGSGTGGGDD